MPHLALAYRSAQEQKEFLQRLVTRRNDQRPDLGLSRIADNRILDGISTRVASARRRIRRFSPVAVQATARAAAIAYAVYFV
jgi:hypothetical protein